MDSSLKTEEIAADIFAADIFAANPAQNDGTTERAAEKSPSWSDDLPAARPAATDWNKLLDNLADDFSENLISAAAESLTRLLNLSGGESIELTSLSRREINETGDFTAGERDSFWLTIAVEGDAAEIYLEFGNAFAASLVDAALGETAAANGQVRELTESEAAVIEFLSINLTHEINLILQSPLFKFRDLSRRTPATLERKIVAPNPSLLVAGWQIVHEKLPAVVNMYLLPESLAALQPDENRLLDNRLRAARRQNLRDTVENVRARVRCGDAELSLRELASLENGDIILLENHNFTLDGANISGAAEIFLGDGENAKIGGRFAGNDSAVEQFTEENPALEDDKILIRPLNPKSDWHFVIENLNEIENPVSHENSMAETDENFTSDETDENADASNGLAIENLAVNLRVELEARRLTIGDIANLRENQTLDLGIRPTDGVNLLVDNQQIGRGELVAVEGRLGVRITKLLR